MFKLIVAIFVVGVTCQQRRTPPSWVPTTGQPFLPTTPGPCNCPIMARPPKNCKYEIEYDHNNCPVKWNLKCDDCDQIDTDTGDGDTDTDGETTTSTKDCPPLATLRRDGLMRYNELRAMHQGAPFQLDDAYNNEAQRWAEYIASIGIGEHNPTKKFATSVIAGNWALTGTQAVDQWYVTGRDYNFSDFRSACCWNFVNIVWKSNKKVGMGCAKNKDGGIFYTAAYDIYRRWPESNVEANMLPPQN